MRFARMLKTLAGRRQPSTVKLFREAARLRDEGRFEDASVLVERGLQRDPASAVGHLMAAWLHTVFRRMPEARAEFERVIAADPTHPRALLGLARIALEQNDEATAADHLRRALARYPDFPEARALLDVIETRVPAAAAYRPAAPLTAARLRIPGDSREVVAARTDGSALFVQPSGPTDGALAVHAAQVVRLAAAVLARAGLGTLATAHIEGRDDRSHVRTDGKLIVTVTVARDAMVGSAEAHLDAVWMAATSLVTPREEHDAGT